MKQICLRAAVGSYIPELPGHSRARHLTRHSGFLCAHASIHFLGWSQIGPILHISHPPKNVLKNSQIPTGSSHQILSSPPIHPAASLAPSLTGLTAGNREPSCMQALRKHFEYLRSAKYLVKVGDPLISWAMCILSEM